MIILTLTGIDDIGDHSEDFCGCDQSSGRRPGKMSNVKLQTSNVKCQMSNVKCQMSNNKFQMSKVKNLKILAVVIREIQEFREKGRRSELFNHLSAVR